MPPEESEALYAKAGEPKKAEKVAFQMLQYYRNASQRYAAIAAKAAEGGNIDLATKAALKAYQNVPDGNDMHMERNEDGTLDVAVGDRIQALVVSTEGGITLSRRLARGVWRIVAPNASAMTGPGTNTYVLGDPPCAVLDPGPDDPAHLAAILALVPRPELVLVTHTHRDHSPLAATLAMHGAVRRIGRPPPAEPAGGAVGVSPKRFCAAARSVPRPKPMSRRPTPSLARAATPWSRR